MTITTFFSDFGSPREALTPTIKITECVSGSVVETGIMTEIQGGFYKYAFNQNPLLDYLVMSDAVVLDQYDRYAPGVISATDAVLLQNVRAIPTAEENANAVLGRVI